MLQKNNWTKALRLVCLAALVLAGWSSPARAQESQPDGPVYVIQAGDSLWDIAQRFGVSLDALESANNITDPSQIAEGQKLVIPGLEGVSGTLVTRTVSFGENLSSLSRQHRVPQALLARLNHLSSPTELYAGANLILPQAAEVQAEGSAGAARRASLQPGQSLLELAAGLGVSPWALAQANALSGTQSVLPGDVLRLPGGGADSLGGLPPEVGAISVEQLPLLQGKTGVIRVTAPPKAALGGSFMGHPLRFFPDAGGDFIALQGVHALAEPGLYTLVLTGTLPAGGNFSFAQAINVGAEDYPYDRPLTVDPATIDPAVTMPEDAQWTALAQPASAERMWSGPFALPSPLPKDYCLSTGDCWTSRYGNRRSYNGSPYDRFHTGLDIAGGAGTEIYAPADGVVIFAGPLTVRGNATMIDHGWGVYTGYMHQSEIRVQVGERVEPGQLIGLVGGTGRVEGPHLHWEVWVGGVQVEPLDWLEGTFP